MSTISLSPNDQNEILESYWGAMQSKIHLDVLYIRNDISLIAKKGYITNLLHVRSNLVENPSGLNAVKIPLLCKEMGIHERDFQRFYDGQRALRDVDIQFRKSKRSFTETKFYSEIGIDGDYFVSAYSPSWGERLSIMDNQSYSYYNVLITAGVTSKHEFNLYLGLLPYLVYGETPYFSIEEWLPELFCLEEGKYTQWRDLRKRVFNPAVKAVSAKTDMCIKEVQAKKEGRKIVGYKMLLEKNIQQFLGEVEEPPKALNLSHPTVKMIRSCFGGSEAEIAQWIADFGEAEVKRCFNYVKDEIPKRSKDKAIKTPIAYLNWYLNNHHTLAKTWEDVIVAEKKRKAEKKLVAQKVAQEELEAQEQAMEKQRSVRRLARNRVESFLASLDPIIREQYELDFVQETKLKLSDKKTFHDWIAEKEDFGNPYPAERATRLRKSLTAKMDL